MVTQFEKTLGAHGVDRKSRKGYPGGQPSCLWVDRHSSFSAATYLSSSPLCASRAPANSLRAGDGDCQAAPGRVAALADACAAFPRTRRCPGLPVLTLRARLFGLTRPSMPHPSRLSRRAIREKKHHHRFGNLI